MSGTVMKFGPQWIRTLTNGAASSTTTTSTTTTTTTNNSTSNNSNTTLAYSSNESAAMSNTITSASNSAGSGSTTAAAVAAAAAAASKYKLAEYRYGREEMLALYEQEMEAPEDIRKFSDLYIEKARMPMAMTQMSEEEVKLSTRNWNSEAVLRSSSGKIAAVAGGPAGSQMTGPTGNSTGSILIDRDNITGNSSSSGNRGGLNNSGSTMTAAGVLSSSPRGPPGSLARIPLEQRGLLSSLNSRGPPSTIRNLVGRGPNLYTRSQSHEDADGNNIDGDLSGGGFDARFNAGQVVGRQPSSLRARFDARASGQQPMTGGLKQINDGLKATTIDGNDTVSDRGVGQRSVFDRLPNKYSVDDKIIRKDANGRPIQSGDWRSRDGWSGSGAGGGTMESKPKSLLQEDPRSGTGSWRSSRGTGGTVEDWRGNNANNTSAPITTTQSTASSSSWYVRTDDQRNNLRSGGAVQNQDQNLNIGFSGKRDTLRRPSIDDRNKDEGEDGGHIQQQQQHLHQHHHQQQQQTRHRRDSLPEWSIGDPLSGDKVGSFDASGAFREIARDDTNDTSSQLKEKNLNEQSNDHQHDGFAHLERAAEIMVAEWTAEEERESSDSPEFLLGNKLNREQQLDAQPNLLQNNSDARLTNQLQHQQQQQQQQSADIQNSTSVVFDDSNNQKKFILLPFNHENSQQWFYRDTQGVIQGPFSANEMFDWYEAGYFVKELLVRRACDELFYPLGDVIKLWDRIPFAPVPIPSPPVTAQALLQLRAVTKHIELAATQGQIPPNAFSMTHPGTVLLHGPLLQQQQQQVQQALAAASLNQNISNPQEQQAGIRQILEATRQHDQALVHQQQRNAAIMPGNITDQNEMQTQLRQLLAQLKNREGFSNLNAQEQQEVLVRQFVASRSTFPAASAGGLQEQDQQNLLQRARMAGPFLPYFSSEQERYRYQQRVEMERRQKEEAEKQNLFIMEQRMKAEEEKQRIMSELQKRQQQQQKQKEENDKQQLRQEAEQERILKLSQLKQQQLAKQQEEFRQQMMNQQRIQQQQQQEKQQKLLQQQQLTSIQQQQQQQQQQQIERAKKAALAQQVQQEQQRKTAWSTVSKPDQEPVSLATLQKLQEEEKEREREKQRILQQQMQQSNQQQHLQQQLQRQMTWANAAQQSKAAPVKTLAEIQKEEEERLAREKQKKTKIQPTIPNAGVWNNAASHLSWKNPPADS